MRYYNITMLHKGGNCNICTLKDRDAAYNLADILRAVVRTYNACNINSQQDFALEVSEDLNHDDDLGSFDVTDLIGSTTLGIIMDKEIKHFIKLNMLWNDKGIVQSETTL